MLKTGVRDKNGEMICLGDIIEYDWENEQDGGHEVETVTYSVKYGGFMPLIKQVCWRMEFKNITICDRKYRVK